MRSNNIHTKNALQNVDSAKKINDVNKRLGNVSHEIKKKRYNLIKSQKFLDNLMSDAINNYETIMVLLK